MTPHDESMLDLVAAHALGAVDAASDECAQVQEHLQVCAICRQEYALARAATTAVGMSAAQAPPPHLRERIIASLPSLQQRVQQPPQQPLQQPLQHPTSVAPMRRPRAWVAGAVAAALLLAAGSWWISQHRTPTWTAACVAGAANCHASAVLTLSKPGQIHVDIKGLDSLPADKTYQAWLIVPGSAPKAEPLIQPDAQGNGSVDIQFQPPKGTVIALTVEPAGGSAQPTTKPFLTGTIE